MPIILICNAMKFCIYISILLTLITVSVRAQWIDPNNDNSGPIYYDNGTVSIGIPNDIVGHLEIIKPFPLIRLQTPNSEVSSLRFTEGGSYRGGFMKYNEGMNMLNIGVHDTETNLLNEDLSVINIFRNNGHVGIGTTNLNTPHLLSVNGDIRAKEVIVDTNWADFVFEENYNLRSIPSLEKYIKTHKHLPEIPSSEQVNKEGINLGDINSKLLQKIEELTLYIIEQDKRIQQLENQIKKL